MIASKASSLNPCKAFHRHKYANMLPNTLFLVLFLPLAACAPFPAAPVPSPKAVDPGDNATEFVRAHCGCTRYPDLCFASLSAYADAVRRNPVLLARVASNVTLARLRALRAHVSALRRAGAAATGREAAALRDCADALGDAADQVGRTTAELRGLEALAGMEVAWRVSNALTWMSAALTNEDTCSDGFGEVPSAGAADADLKSDMCRRVRRVKQYTSNALALVSGLV
ncbi:hypothetical protein Cni_G22978 [Canna indica]|uniref:Pectinesterase inhibitor domain-containing protein n=1 Tax=Canna indica TaxID=4628 RepID=A0AAQ3KW71_9LILI|nr:hypothetical protein Cni_G22978 [Canna indica]